MVVWRGHGADPPEEDVRHMLARLEEVARVRFADVPFTIDRVMRQIPDHFHAHARDRDWWFRRARLI
jgi:hypothetical protein